MKWRKNIYLIIGILLIVFNLLAYLGGAKMQPEDPFADSGVRIGYFIGSNIFLIVGIVFVFLSYRVRQKMKKKKDADLVDTLFKD